MASDLLCNFLFLLTSPSAEITDVGHQAGFMQYWGPSSGLCACYSALHQLSYTPRTHNNLTYYNIYIMRCWGGTQDFRNSRQTVPIKCIPCLLSTFLFWDGGLTGCPRLALTFHPSEQLAPQVHVTRQSGGRVPEAPYANVTMKCIVRCS